ncbi:MAG TPA: hypothetical protein VGC32_06280 [Solirubrobacterales bacterium]
MPAEHSTSAERAAPTGLGAYRELLRLPGARALALASLLVRIPFGMVGIGLILFLHERTGSFAAAGFASGAYVVGLGATGPLLARVIDQTGSRPVLLGGGLVSAASLVLVFALGEAGAAAGALAAAALLAGASTPPFGSVARRRWSALASPPLLPTAYAIEAIVLEAMFVLGPRWSACSPPPSGQAPRSSSPPRRAPRAPSGSPRWFASRPARRPRAGATRRARSASPSSASSSSPGCRWAPGSPGSSWRCRPSGRPTATPRSAARSRRCWRSAR